MRRLGWQRGCALAIGMGLAALLMAGLLAGASVRRGMLVPPWFDRRFGSLRIVGYTTWNASCPPYVGCPPTRFEAYVVWLLVQPQSSNTPAQHARQFLRLPIDHDQ